MKKFISIFLCITIVFGIIYMSGYAADTVINGKLNNSVTYSFDTKTGVFNINGSGAVPDFPGVGIDFAQKDSVTSVIVNSGITKIGNDSFWDWNSIKSIYVLNAKCTVSGENTIPKNAVIIAKANSSTQSFATTNNRIFKALTENTCPGHKYGKNALVTKATVSADGKHEKTCEICGKKVTTVVKKIATVSLSTTKYQYNGTLRKPVVTVKNSNGTALTRNKHYTITYPTNSINVGTYNVTVKFMGSYSGSKVLSFKIVPGTPVITSAVPSFRSATIYWKKLGGITGYQLQYCTKSDFKSAKTIAIANSATYKSVTGLGNSTTYYFRLRSYKTISKVNNYSAWSSVKKITTYKAEKYHINKNGIDIRIVRGTYGKITQRFDKNVSWQIVNPKTITYNPAYNIAVITVDAPTRLHLSKGTKLKNTDAIARSVGALIALNGQTAHNGKVYDTSLSAVIRDGNVYKSYTGSGGGYGTVVMYKDGTWKIDTLNTENTKNAIKNGAYNSYQFYGQIIASGKSTGDIKDIVPYRNGSYFAQISPRKYILMTAEFMPISSATKILLQYGAKTAVYVNGGNCAHMYVKGIGNTTGSKGKQIVNLDKVGYLETELMAKYGLLEGKKGGSPCEHEADVIYFK